MNPVTPTRAATRGLLAFAFGIAAVVSVAARPASPGVTYRVRLSAPAPDMPGMGPMPSTLIVGRGMSLGSQSRMEIDTVQGQIPMVVGDYVLSLDSGKTLLVSPANKTFSEGLPGLNAMPPELLAQASLSNVNVTTEKLGAGETLQGFPTEKVRMTATYSIAIMGTVLNTMSTVEMWMTQLPATVTTPFDGSTMPKEMSEGPMKELADKVMAARKSLGNATPIKVVSTSSISGPMSLTTVSTLELLDVKAADVDPASFKVPEGFTKKP